MKVKKLSFAIIAMAIVAVAVAVVACKKEKQEQTSNEQKQSVQHADNMDEYLISFREKMLSAQKGIEFISLEQAQCDLGNLLNFDFGDANYYPEVIRKDTLHVELSLTNGQVDLSQLAVTYEKAVNSILKTYHEIDLPYKTIYCILCEFNSLESKDAESADGEIIVITSSDPGAIYTNHDTMDWRPKNWAGTCDGQFVGTYGAPEIIRSWIFQSLDAIACTNGGRVYYTNISTWGAGGFNFYDNTLGRFRVYTSFEPNQDDVCISHDEMEYYFSQILDIYDQQSQAFTYPRIYSVSIIHKHYVNTYIPALNQVRTFYSWRLEIGHGKPNCTNNPPIDF